MTKDDALIVDLPVDDITVEIEPDGLPKTVPVIRDAKPDVINEDNSDPQIEALTKERDEFKRESEESKAQAAENARIAQEERTARTQTEGKLSEASLAQRRDQWSIINAHHNQILGGINTAKMELQAAKKAVADATAAGDGEKLADAQEKLADSRYDLRKLEEGKEGIERDIRAFEQTIRTEAEQRKTTPEPTESRQQPQPAVQTQRSPTDYIAQVRTNLGGKIADWLTENPEFVTNPQLNKKAAELVNARIAEGKPLNSQAFIKTLNDTFFAEDTEMSDPTPEAKPKVEAAKPAATAKPKTVPAAPVSRGSGDFFSSTNPNGNRIRLHPVLAKAASDIGMTAEDYAAGIKAEIKKGKLPKTYLDADYPHEAV